MELFYRWGRTVALAVILATVVELVLPSDRMARYVRVTLGLVVVLAVMAPVLAFLGRGWDPAAVWQLEAIADSHALAERTGEVLARQVESLAASVPGVRVLGAWVEVDAGLRPRAIRVRVALESPGDGDTLRTALTRSLASLYGLPVEQVKVDLGPAPGGNGR